jgi:tetratricopeptide (TPR) repeat protein
MRAGEPGGQSRARTTSGAAAVARSGPPLNPAEAEAVLRRLVANPFDEEALAAAYRAGGSDPAGLAMLLERIAAATRDGKVACHWLSEAEAIWSNTLRNRRNSARALSTALHRDPLQHTIVERLSSLPREERAAVGLDGIIEERVRTLISTGRSGLTARVELAALDAIGGGEGSAETYEKFCRVLDASPDPATLDWALDRLRSEGEPSALRDVLLLAAKTTVRTAEQRKESLQELARISGEDLRDTDGAIRAWKMLLWLDRSDREARQALATLLEEARRWDDLCVLLERAAACETDLEKKLALQHKAAALHEHERHDLGAAAEALAFVANVTPTADAISAAASLFDKANEPARAAQIIADNIACVEEPTERAPLLERLGEVREALSDPVGAAEAYEGAAELLGLALLWEAAERCFVAGEAWEGAARIRITRAHGGGAPTERARHFARAAEYLDKVGDEERSRQHRELAVALDPSRGDCIRRLLDAYAASQDWEELVDLVERAASHVREAKGRVALRVTAANVCSALLGDRARGLALWRLVLDDGDVPDALEPLIEDALTRGNPEEARSLIERLGAVAAQGAERSANVWRGRLETRIVLEPSAAAAPPPSVET